VAVAQPYGRPGVVIIRQRSTWPPLASSREAADCHGCLAIDRYHRQESTPRQASGKMGSFLPICDNRRRLMALLLLIDLPQLPVSMALFHSLLAATSLPELSSSDRRQDDF